MTAFDVPQRALLEPELVGGNRPGDLKLAASVQPSGTVGLGHEHESARLCRQSQAEFCRSLAKGDLSALLCGSMLPELGRYRRDKRQLRSSGQVATCSGLHYSARVAGIRRLRTADYSEAARARLGQAVVKARQAAGHKWRTNFARAARISVRSVSAIEQAEPTVGQANLYAVGRALPNWDEDTPRVILEGGPIPSNEPESSDLVRIAVNALADLEIRGADATLYNQELARWEHILGGEANITDVRKEAHRVAGERLANPQSNST